MFGVSLAQLPGMIPVIIVTVVIAQGISVEFSRVSKDEQETKCWDIYSDFIKVNLQGQGLSRSQRVLLILRVGKVQIARAEYVLTIIARSV